MSNTWAKKDICPGSGNPAPTRNPFPAHSRSPLVANPHWLQGVAQPLMKINCNQCASWAAINCTKSSRVEPRRVEWSLPNGNELRKLQLQLQPAADFLLDPLRTENWDPSTGNWELRSRNRAACRWLWHRRVVWFTSSRDPTRRWRQLNCHLHGKCWMAFAAGPDWARPELGPPPAASRRPERGTCLFVGGTMQLMNCSCCAASCQLIVATLLPSQRFVSVHQCKPLHCLLPPPHAYVCCIINIICVGQKSVPWMDRWSSLFLLNS